MGRRDYVDSDSGTAVIDRAECIAETGIAMLVRFAPPNRAIRTVWIPKAVVHDDSEVFDSRENARGKLVLQAWWADQEGITT